MEMKLMNNQSQILGFRVAGLLVPVLAVIGFQFFMDEPSKASASMSDTQFLPLPVVPEWSGEQPPLDVNPNSSSPFWFEDVELQVQTIPMLPKPQVQEEAEPDPEFFLTAVLPSTNKSLAMINGKPHSVGDEVVKGWTLIKIAGKERYVILKHTSGRQLQISMHQN